MIKNSLGTVTEIIESFDMSVCYAYEDLVFLDQPHYLLQFTENEEVVIVHVNEENMEDQVKVSLQVLQKRAEEYTMHFIKGGYFRMTLDHDDHIHIEFLTVQ